MMWFMEVPRYWREMSINTSFSGKEITGKSDLHVFKYPGGEIVLSGTFEDVYRSFENKGFRQEVIDEILFDLFGAVASESAISFQELVNRKSELVGSEVRK